MYWNLPYSLDISGQEYEIRTDFRAILDILSVFNAPDLTDAEKAEFVIEVLYHPDTPPVEHLQEAFDKAIWFLDCSMKHDDTKPKPRTMDWEQDAPIIFPAINKVAGREVRGRDEIHWWTFYGWFMEIEEGLFSQVLSIRQKKAKGKKLEKWETEFLKENKSLIALEKKESDADLARKEKEKEALEKLIGKAR